MNKRTKRHRRFRKNRRTRYRKRGGAYITYSTDGGDNRALASQLITAYQTNHMNKIMNS